MKLSSEVTVAFLNKTFGSRRGRFFKLNAEQEVDSGRRQLVTGKFLTDRLEPSSEFGVSVLECAARENDDDGVLWIDYALVNGGSARTNVFVHLRKVQPKRLVKVLHLDPEEVFRGSCREPGYKQAEQIFLEFEASSGTNSQREVFKVSKATATESTVQSLDGGGVSILECAARENDDDGVLWIDYALVNGGSARTNVFVHLRKVQPKRSVKVLHLDPEEVFRGSCREPAYKQAEQIFLEFEASSGTNSQREVFKVSKATAKEEET